MEANMEGGLAAQLTVENDVIPKTILINSRTIGTFTRLTFFLNTILYTVILYTIIEKQDYHNRGRKMIR